MNLRFNAIQTLIEATKDGATLITFPYTKKTTGEKAQYTLDFGIDYRAAVEHDRAALVAYVPQNDLEIEAKDQMLKSMTETIDEGVSKSYTQKDTFESLGKGIRQHKETGDIYIDGFVHSKIQICPPTTIKKPVQSKPLTLAKHGIEKVCEFKRNRYGHFIHSPENIGEIVLKGNLLEIV